MSQTETFTLIALAPAFVGFMAWWITEMIVLPIIHDPFKVTK